MADFIADIHCHPDMKPFGRSYPAGFRHSPDPRSTASVWHYDPPRGTDGVEGLLFGLTRYRQSDLQSGALGRVRLLIVALYPLERGFVTGHNGRRHGPRIDALADLATGVGPACIDATQSTEDYYPTLLHQYDFWQQLNGQQIIDRDGSPRRYHLCGSQTELQQALADPTGTAVLLSVEGAHSFGPGAIYEERPYDPAQLLAHVSEVKAWKHRPLFVTLMHHFYNELGGHAPSLAGAVALSTNQSPFCSKPLNDLGRQVIRRLLDPADGRILIDLKHMSRASRQDYYTLLAAEYPPDSVPLVVSHGGVAGSTDINPNPFLDAEINFQDEELVRIGRSGGLFGVQLDQRRIASREVIRRNKLGLARGKWRWSGLVWQQLRHVAEVLDRAGLPAWNTACFGTDFDGIVNPIRRFTTHEDLPELAHWLLEHIREYFEQSGGPPLQVPANRAISPEAVLDRFVSGNVLAFVQRGLPV